MSFPDYEAALRLHTESRLPIISGAQCDNELAAVKRLVDAALGGFKPSPTEGYEFDNNGPKPVDPRGFAPAFPFRYVIARHNEQYWGWYERKIGWDT